MTHFGRRHFLQHTAAGLGGLVLSSLLARREASADPGQAGRAARLPHTAPRARSVIFLHQSGAPSQVDLFDDKPELRRRHGEELPESIRRGQVLTTMTAGQKSKPLTASPFRFARHGRCGATVSELLPFTSRIVDDLCFIRSLWTEAINHEPAMSLLQTGSMRPGRPAMGAWLSYALGGEEADLPAFVIMLSGGEPGDQPLAGRLWGAGFLPTEFQGVRLRSRGDPVLFLSDPPGIDAAVRERQLQGLAQLNALQYERIADPEILSRTAQFRLALRMQRSIPRVADLADEPAHTFRLYGEEARTPGTYAANCLLARRLVERGVPFVQLYHRGWDHHDHLPSRIRRKCSETDQSSAALVADLNQRGLLDETLVIWSGEFGRTAYCQGRLNSDAYGRDHHPRCFSVWLAGGGVRAGAMVGKTDDFSYNVVEDPIHIHDLQATVLHCLGIDHQRLTYRHQGHDFRLTDVGGSVVNEILQ